ncbi:MAG TPA: hypothetical protein VJ385_15755 [Fibrobacteria bacterium]|nr:hypothetical protein [Fibrobacteria bacterium]
MQTQNVSPAAGGPRTILLGRNRPGTLAEPRAIVVKSFERRTNVPRPSPSVGRSVAADAPIAHPVPAAAPAAGRSALP